MSQWWQYINPLNNNIKNFDINIKYHISDFNNVIDSLNLIYDNQIFGSKQRFLYISGLAYLLRLNEQFVGNKVNITHDLWFKSHYVLLRGLHTINTRYDDDPNAETIDDTLIRLIDFFKEWKKYCIENESNDNYDNNSDVDWTFEYLKTIGQSNDEKFSKFNDLIMCNKDLQCCCDDYSGYLQWKVVWSLNVADIIFNCQFFVVLFVHLCAMCLAWIKLSTVMTTKRW